MMHNTHDSAAYFAVVLNRSVSLKSNPFAASALLSPRRPPPALPRDGRFDDDMAREQHDPNNEAWTNVVLRSNNRYRDVR